VKPLATGVTVTRGIIISDLGDAALPQGKSGPGLVSVSQEIDNGKLSIKFLVVWSLKNIMTHLVKY
jgi:hypothetical protein